MAKQTVPPLPLPKGWPRRVRSAAVHAIALARLALTTAREPLLAQPMVEMPIFRTSLSVDHYTSRHK